MTGVKQIATLAVLTGILAGTGAFTFRYAEGLSYLSADPRACVNCHIMTPQYDSWQKSSHHAVATCVECHLPHSFIPKYIAKAENGYHHSLAFTLQNFHEPIMIKVRNSRILQHNCVRCHEAMVFEMFRRDTTQTDSFRCIHCHAGAGHGTPPTGIGGPDRGEEKERQNHEHNR